jgi:hypothetical protein
MQDPVDRLVERNADRDVRLDQAKGVVVGKVSDVVGRSGEVVVNADDLMPVAEEAVAEMRAEKPRDARNDNFHAIVLRPIE